MITHAVVSSTGSDSDVKAAVGVARSLMSAGVDNVCFTGWGRPITVSFGRTVVRTAPNREWLANFANSADEVLTVDSSSLPPEDVDADFIASMSGKTGPVKAVSDGRSLYVLGRDLFQDAVKSGESGIGEALRRMGVETEVVGTPVVDPVPDMKRPAVQRKATFLRRGDPSPDGIIGRKREVVASGEPLPVLPIVFLTHDRTRVARETVRHLVKNIRYDGPIKWCLCDDRSMPGHVGSIFNLLTELGVDDGDISVFSSTKDRYGLGASMNNGLKYSFGIGDIALTVEDDWILERELDITPYVRVIMSDSRIGIIRLSTCVGVDKSESYNDFLSRVVGNNRYPYVMVHQVALRHRRVYDVLGMYRENCPAGETEKAMSDSYNMRFRYGRDNRCIVLTPSCIKRNALDGEDLYFIHVGLSTIGHSEYNVPLRYAYLYSRERAVVSMTSYPGRISNVARSIKFIMDCQTERPDELHLWLANDEFPEGWKGLPDDLRSELRRPYANLHWVPTNTYCHKRHEVFKWLPDDSCVFLIDDDVRYDDRLVESTLSLHMENPTSVINYERYSEHLYSGRKILYGNLDKFRSPTFRVRMCGQSMIPSMVYPRMSLSPDNVAIRDLVTPINDELWLQPWLVHSRIPVLNQHFGWGVDIDKKIDHRMGLCRYSAETQENGMSRNDTWLSRILEAFPAFMNDYVVLFGYGNKM